jgi:hypothetical protein
MFDAGIKSKRDGHGFHVVIICDEAGIFDAFIYVKDRLAAARGTEFLSLIYTVSEKNLHPLFEQELSILEKRYADNLIVHTLSIDTYSFFFKQEILEATINSNTLPKMKFLVFGNAEFVNYVSEVLRFLDVKAFMVHVKII